MINKTAHLTKRQIAILRLQGLIAFGQHDPLAASIEGEVSRRQWFQSAAVGAAVATLLPGYALAAENDAPKRPKVSLEDSLYLILRVREATQQETTCKDWRREAGTSEIL